MTAVARALGRWRTRAVNALSPGAHTGLPAAIPAMSISGPGLFADGKATVSGDPGRSVLWLVWQCMRLPLTLVLVVLEPVASFVLGALALLGVLTVFFWKLVGPPHFPFLLVLGISLGFRLVLLFYHKLLRLLSG